MHESKAGILTFVEQWDQRLLLPGGFSHRRGVWVGPLKSVRSHTRYPSPSSGAVGKVSFSLSLALLLEFLKPEHL